MADAPNPEPTSKKGKPELPHCGIIMPISGSADYPASHWADMLQLIKEAAQDAKYTCEIVSATGRDDIIHASIVTNIYQNEMVICDVSSRNPNVMLELGLRLASKLPIIIIFDEEGNYPFDIGTIRYLSYRRDMRYYDMNKFKKELTAKILEVADTHQKGKYQSFLSHFKNIDFDLDSVGTEKQNLTQVLENIGNRLSGLENNKPQQSPGKLLNSTQIRPLVTRSVTNYLSSKGIPISDDMPKAVLREAYEAIRRDKANVLSTIEPELLLGHVYEWDDNDLPF